MGLRVKRGVLGIAVLGLWLVASLVQAGTPVVAAAANLKFALEEVAAAFKRSQGGDLRLVFGSSGNFYRQLRQGAPFELFLSADEQYVHRLAEAGLTEGAGEVYAVGRLVYFVPDGSPLEAQAGLDGLREALQQGKVRRFAIANPDHAPYGRAAMAVLESAGVAPAIEPYLIQGENVTQAAQFAVSGSTQGGLIAHSLALSPPIAAKGRFQLVPQTLHESLRQRMVLMKGAGDTARQFYHYLQSSEARSILAGYGFGLPGSD